MISQKSFQNQKPTLFLVPTPIGNLNDMTPRALQILEDVDIIYAEDTRVTKNLLSHFNIQKEIRSYHLFNENIVANEIIKILENQKNVAIVSDAGLPLISDPGYLVCKLAIANGFNVVSLPGANAALTALVASGISPERFYFYGFLNHKKSQKKKELKALVDFKDTLIFYEAPHRIKETLLIMYEVFGDRDVVIARELTKMYEEYIRGTLKAVINYDFQEKGEFVIIVGGAKISSEVARLNSLSIDEHYNYYLNIGYNTKDAMKQVASDRNISKSEVYKELINKK